MEKLLTLSEIRTQVYQLAEKISVSYDTLPSFGHPTGIGETYIEVDSSGYHYVKQERGREFSRQTTLELDECLYWIFKSVTLTLAIKYELSHRVENKASRRIMYPYQTELLSKLSPDWGKRITREHEERLREHPFDDYALSRATLIGNLISQGYSRAEAESIAREKYPKSEK